MFKLLEGSARQAVYDSREEQDYDVIEEMLRRFFNVTDESNRKLFRNSRWNTKVPPEQHVRLMEQRFKQWVKPENGCEQALGKLLVEGVLASLPVKMKSWIESQGVRECREIPALMQRYSDSFGGSYSELVSTTRDKKLASESHFEREEFYG